MQNMFKQRLKICKKCPNFKETNPVLGHGICSVCKCVMGLKLNIPDQKCPEGRWLEWN